MAMGQLGGSISHAVLVTVGWRAFGSLTATWRLTSQFYPSLIHCPGLADIHLRIQPEFLSRSLSVSQRRWGVILCLIGLLALMQWQRSSMMCTGPDIDFGGVALRW